MLQRAASNAYSWWWASHIRTKQGKWLEESLKDMEDRVKRILQIIEEDADSFARRAEMYYKKRPELINFVEESYKAYRALADRYEHISRELHKANNTIASVCPDQVAFMEEDGEDRDNGDGKNDRDDDRDDEQEQPPPPPPPKSPPLDPEEIPKPVTEQTKFDLKPNSPSKEPKSPLTPRSPLAPRSPLPPRSPFPQKPKKPQPTKTVSQKSKTKAQGKIDKLQKGILVLQTEKEFVKSSYETGLAKYWDIENQITEMQQEVCSLQEEFSVDADDTVIEDNEARALMTSMALKSCKDSLVQLQVRQTKLIGDARQESKRVKDAKKRLNALKDGSRKLRTDSGKPSDSTIEKLEGDGGVLKQEGLELQSICGKIKEYFEKHSNSASTVTELAEKVDELVTIVLGLETKISSQIAYTERLKSESEELQNRVNSLEEDKKSSKSKEWNAKVGEVEMELQGVQDLNQIVEDGNSALQTAFMEACRTFGGLLKKIQTAKQEQEEASSSEIEEEASPAPGSRVEQTHERALMASANLLVNSTDITREPEVDAAGLRKQNRGEEEDTPDWQQLFLNGLEGREKVLLTEYTSILRNYKETKRKLSEVETKTQETLAKVTELKSSNATKDMEIQSLRKKLGFSHASLEGDSNTLLLEVDISKSANYDEKSTDEKSYKILEELLYDKKRVPSTVEEKFRQDIDQLVEENLQSLLRFSSSSQQIHKFQPTVQELHSDFLRARKNIKQESSNNASDNTSVEAAPLNKRLKELRTELFLWVGQNELLKEELQCRLVSLNNIEEELSRVLENCFASELTPYQAAKFQGEIRNMRHETNKIADELQGGLDHVKNLQLELEKLPKTRGNAEPSGVKNSHNRYHNVRYSTGKSKIPLRSFIFGVKAKKNLMPSGDSCHESQKGDSQNLTKESRKGDSTHSTQEARKGDSTHSTKESRKGDSTHSTKESRKGDSTHSTKESRKGDSTHSTKESRKGDSQHSTKER